MWGIYRETDPATGVEGSLWCRLVSSAESHLVVWAANHLRVFRLNPYLEARAAGEGAGEGSGEGAEEPPRGDEEGRTGLEEVLSSVLLSPMASVVSARLPSSTRDCLLVSFEEAKLAVLAYDPATHSLATLSLHAFEDELLKAGFTRNIPLPMLAAEPEGRCAAMLVYGRHLGVLPLSSSAATAGTFEELDAALEGGAAVADPQTLPSLSLFSYALSLDSVDERLGNVTDMAFLHGYYEPTLLFLFEPAQTIAGRVAVRQDSYCILALSLNVKDRVHAVIWTLHSLPFDSLRLCPVPKPIQGCVVVAENSLIYLNQSVPAYGVSLNSRLQGATNFPMRDQEHKRLSLEVATADFVLPNTLALGTAGGHLWFVSLLIDNTSAVKGMHLEKSSVCTGSDSTSVTACSDGWLFLGSRLGDSSLLKYWEAGSFPVQVSNQPSQAKSSEDAAAETATNGEAAGNGEASDPLDDLAIYGEVVAVETVDTIRVTRYGVHISDRLFCAGPCRDMTLGIPAQIPLPLRTQQLDPIVDLVFASGHDASGALLVCQKQLRPNILTSSSIPGALELFTVGGRGTELSEEEVESGAVPESQRFLLVSKEVGTMVLELGLEISELETSGFCMEQRTVGAGDVLGGAYVLQVCAMCVVLLRGSERIDCRELDTSFPVAHVSFADPFTVLLTQNGELWLVELAETAGGHHVLELSRPELGGRSPVTAAAAFRDASGLFRLSDGQSAEDRKARQQKEKKDREAKDHLHAKLRGRRSQAPQTVQDEDALLYGYDDQENKPKIFAESALIPPDLYFAHKSITTTLKKPESVEATLWLVVSRENGALEFFTLPELKPVFLGKKFPLCHSTVYDSDPTLLGSEAETSTSSASATQRSQDEQFPLVRELCLLGLGPNGARPHLVAVVGDEVVVYEVFPFDEGFPDHLAFRLKRLAHDVVLRNGRAAKGRKRGLGQDLGRAFPEESQLEGFERLLQPFSGLGSEGGRALSGLFLAGPYPHWLLLGDNGALRAHPMSCDGPVRSLAAFHNGNCERGFLYLTETAQMRICQLSSSMELEAASFPHRRVPLGRTVHGLEYLLDSNTYALVTSVPRPNNKIVSLNGEEKQFEEVDKTADPNYILPIVRDYKIQVFDPESWAPVPKSGDIDLEEFEQTTVFKEVQLNSEASISGLQNYLAIGTILNYGEEMLVRGRILICEVIEVVPEVEEPETKRKIKTLYAKEQKGPVTSLCSVRGFLLSALASKVYIWNFRDNDLVGISFIDMQFYIHGMVGLRNVALVADVYRSMSLLRYQDYAKALSLASRDVRSTAVQASPMAVSFLIDGKEVGFLMADEEKNLSVLSYQPEDPYSNGGVRLVPSGDLHMGTRVAAFARLQSHVSDPVVENKGQGLQRHINVFGSLDGHLGFVAPLSERTFRRLHTLQTALVSHVPHLAGLNPKAARALRGLKGGTFTAQKNMVDGNLVFTYLRLSLPEKADLAKRIGSTREQLLDDLLEIQRTATPF